MNDKAQQGGPASGSPLKGRRRLAIIVVTVVAAALVGTGAVIAVVQNISDPSATSTEPGSALPTGVPTDGATPSPTDLPTDGATEPSGETGEGAPGGEAPPVADPVEIDSPAEFVESVRAEVTAIEAVTGEAAGPGEIAGPALRVTVTLTNDTSNPLPLDTSVVALYFGSDDSPAAELSGPGRKPFSGTLAARTATTATYVFSVPEDQRDDLRITVSYSATDSTVAFEGSADQA